MLASLQALFNVVWPIFMKNKLGDAYDEKTAAAWTKVCELLLQATKEELERLEAQ